jgi:hypothetical protein
MLKKRIKKWDLERKNKHTDMLFALRLALDREAKGKKTVFSIRGRLVTFENVKHYFRRKGIRDLQSLASVANSFCPTTQIDCRTPEPEMPVERRASRNPESLEDAEEPSPQHEFPATNINVDTVVALPDPNQVDRTISVTSILGQVEELLYLGRAYYDAIFDNPEWKSNRSIFDVRTLETFYNHMFDGQLLLEESNVTEAFIHFGYAFDLVRSLLDHQVLLFLPYLYHLLLPDWRIQRQEVISQLLDFIARMPTMCYPQLRPVQQSLWLLSRISVEDRGETSYRAFQSVLDRLRIQFECDLIDISETDPNILCFRVRSDFAGDQNVDNYKLTSMAVRGLARDADELLGRRDEMVGLRIDHHDIPCFSEQRWQESLIPENPLFFESMDPRPGFIHLKPSSLSSTNIRHLQSQSTPKSQEVISDVEEIQESSTATIKPRLRLLQHFHQHYSRERVLYDSRDSLPEPICEWVQHHHEFDHRPYQPHSMGLTLLAKRTKEASPEDSGYLNFTLEQRADVECSPERLTSSSLERLD